LRREKANGFLEELDRLMVSSRQVMKSPFDEQRVGSLDRMLHRVEERARFPHIRQAALVTEDDERIGRLAQQSGSELRCWSKRERPFEVFEGGDGVTGKPAALAHLLFDRHAFIREPQGFRAFKGAAVRG
jgi:hypothetical protein